MSIDWKKRSKPPVEVTIAAEDVLMYEHIATFRLRYPDVRVIEAGEDSTLKCACCSAPSVVLASRDRHHVGYCGVHLHKASKGDYESLWAGTGLFESRGSLGGE